MQTALPRLVTAIWLVWLIGARAQVIPLLGALFGVPRWGVFVVDWVFPWVFVAGSITMVVSFHARRHRGQLTKTSRGDHRFAGWLAALGTLTGLNNYGIFIVVIGAVCMAAMLVRTPVPHVPLGQLPGGGEPDA